MELSAAPRPVAADHAALLPPPSPTLRAAVAIPARDEEARIGACLDALAGQLDVAPEDHEAIVVLDACADGTAAAVAAARARHPRLVVHTIPGPGEGAGPARAAGMDVACARLEAAGAAAGLLASTDADTRVAPDWLASQLAALAAGAEAVGGAIELDPAEAAALPPGVLAGRAAELVERTANAAARGPAEHAHFSGASLGVTPRAYREVGGMARLAALEDQELEDRLAAAGVAIHRPRAVRVVTAARTDGRAERGLARDLELGRWLARRSYDGSRYRLEELVAAKTGTVAAILPARECGATIGATVAALAPLREAGLLDRVLVVDADSADGTAERARAAGAEAVSESALAPQLGPCRGKGDAMWRGAGAVDSDTLVFLDADSSDFRAEFVTGLIGPLLEDPGLALVKGAFLRPFAHGDGATSDGEGGRVTELVARPLLNLHFPRLAGFAQPLAGEIAIRRELFARLEVPVGYGVEIAMMVDALRLVGLDALAQVDLGSRQNRHQSLRALSLMAAEVMVAVERRTGAPPRPGSPSFHPRAEPGEAPEVWRLRTEERPPLVAALV